MTVFGGLVLSAFSACSPDKPATRDSDAGISLDGSSSGGQIPDEAGTTASGGSGGTTGSGGTSTGGSSAGGDGTGGTGEACGYQGRGKVLQVTADITLCLPPVVCAPETCPPELGDCVDGTCVFKGNYKGLATLPEAWATQYCALQGAGCNGVSQFNRVEVTAQMLADKFGYSLCGPGISGTCVGIVASPPMMVGNSEVTKVPGTETYLPEWGLGMTEASGLCYEVTGPGGTALLAITDRCAGYCNCSGGSDFNECGTCVNADNLAVQCSCVGTVPGVYDQCCGRLCRGPMDIGVPNCDWCASNNHPHFDLDDAAFAHVCGDQGAMYGSCQLSKARFVPCLDPHPDWPPNR